MYVVIGFAVLGNGAALLLYILRSVPMPPALLVLWAAGVATIVVAFVRSDPELRRSFGRAFLVGAVVGLGATALYDVSKVLLSQLDPAPWNPFEAIRVMGVALIGPDAPDELTHAVGWAFHLSNGMTFGIAFTFLFGGLAARGVVRGVALGVAWGLFLETFQLSLFPGWMNIRFLDEFRQVSFAAHLVFGGTLGLLVPAGLRRLQREG